MPEITSTTQRQIRFTVRDAVHGDYTDAIYLTEEAFAAATPEQIEAMQMARFANWVAAITAPPAPVVDEPPADPAAGPQAQE